MDAIRIIGDGRELAEFTAGLGRGGAVAVDTEFLRERTFAPKLCLIQLTDGAQTACVDPLAVDDLSPLAELIADPSRVKIFHSCRQDLEALATRIAARAANLYDTQLAAAFCGHGAQASYAALVEAVCEVRLAKAHTRADWSRRPLPRAELEYALDDIKYLHPLRRTFDRELARKGYADWLREECEYAADPARIRADPDSAWLRLKGVERLDAAGQICAQRLAAWRERRAVQRDLPRNWILPSPALVNICRKLPATPAELAGINGIAPSTAKRAGKHILALVAEAMRDAPRRPPLPALGAERRRVVKKITGRLAGLAEQTGISQTLIAGRQEVEDFARGAAPDGLRLFQGWRRELVGEEILAAFA